VLFSENPSSVPQKSVSKEKPRPWRAGASKNQMRLHYLPEPARIAR
jgi:hypothetical protein